MCRWHVRNNMKYATMRWVCGDVIGCALRNMYIYKLIFSSICFFFCEMKLVWFFAYAHTHHSDSHRRWMYRIYTRWLRNAPLLCAKRILRQWEKTIKTTSTLRNKSAYDVLLSLLTLNGSPHIVFHLISLTHCTMLIRILKRKQWPKKLSCHFAACSA